MSDPIHTIRALPVLNLDKGTGSEEQTTFQNLAKALKQGRVRLFRNHSTECRLLKQAKSFAQVHCSL